jgi:metal-sulfur cluster biosynthetic enzyme
MVREVEIRGGDVEVTIALTIAGCPLRHSFQEQVTRVQEQSVGIVKSLPLIS